MTDLKVKTLPMPGGPPQPGQDPAFDRLVEEELRKRAVVPAPQGEEACMSRNPTTTVSPSS